MKQFRSCGYLLPADRQSQLYLIVYYLYKIKGYARLMIIRSFMLICLSIFLLNFIISLKHTGPLRINYHNKENLVRL